MSGVRCSLGSLADRHPGGVIETIEIRDDARATTFPGIMGTFIYNGSIEAEFDDRALVHIEKVVLAKLRRHEAFAFTWDDADGGRCTVWLERAMSIAFRYGAAVDDINRQWLDVLMETANSGGGLVMVDEPQPAPRQASRAGSAA